MLRKLEEKDAELMLEWMHDKRVNKRFAKDFSEYKLSDAIQFINDSRNSKDMHYAIVNKLDEYLGTASLQRISYKDLNAEYSLVIRYDYITQENIIRASMEIASIAFNQLKMNRLYINVLEDDIDNIQAYERLGFKKEGTFVGQRMIGGKYHNLCWYALINPVISLSEPKEPYRVLKFKEMGDARGHLVVIEGMVDVPFDIKRIFYIYGSDQNVIRGQHANRKTEFVLINVAGTSKIKVDDGIKREIIELTRPHMGVYLPKMLWKDMYEFSPDSVLLVLASEHYDDSEYIRNYNEFIAEINAN